MIKVFILSPLALENGRGGEISSMELASGLNKFYDVTFMDTNIFIGESLITNKTIKKKLNGLEKRGRIKFATINILNRFFNFPYPWEVIKLYNQIKQNDIIYTSFSNFKINFMFMLFSLFHTKARYIIGYRKPLHSEKLFSLYNIKYRLSILFFSLFKKRFYHHTLSKYAKNFLENFYDTNKVKFIVHGINLDDFTDDSNKKKRYDLLKFCYIGFLDDIHKGVSILLQAIEKLLNEDKNLKVFFEFCGIGPLSEKLKKLEAKFPEFIKYHGYISNDLIAKYYMRNDVFLFSSRREPFPRSIMEALAAKLLIISSQTIGSIELLKGRKFGFFIRELSPEAIKVKILELFNLWKSDPVRFRELQNSARDYIFKNYSTSREIDMFRNLIDKIYQEIRKN